MHLEIKITKEVEDTDQAKDVYDEVKEKLKDIPDIAIVGLASNLTVWKGTD